MIGTAIIALMPSAVAGPLQQWLISADSVRRGRTQLNYALHVIAIHPDPRDPGKT